VGYYPNSTFVAVDGREEAAYWVDRSGPGPAPDYAPKPDAAAPEPATTEPATSDPEANDAALQSLADRALVVMNGAFGRSPSFDTALPSRHAL
jgi:hypothetical protein